MKVYKYEKSKGVSPRFFPHTWTTTEKNNKITFFQSDVGYQTVAISKTISFDIPNMPKIDYSYIQSTYSNYGYDVTMELLKASNHTCCDMRLSDYIFIALHAKDTVSINALQMLGFDTRQYLDRVLTYFGVYIFPILELDNFCHKKLGYEEEKQGSLKDFLLKITGMSIEI